MIWPRSRRASVRIQRELFWRTIFDRPQLDDYYAPRVTTRVRDPAEEDEARTPALDAPLVQTPEERPPCAVKAVRDSEGMAIGMARCRTGAWRGFDPSLAGWPLDIRRNQCTRLGCFQQSSISHPRLKSGKSYMLLRVRHNNDRGVGTWRRRERHDRFSNPAHNSSATYRQMPMGAVLRLTLDTLRKWTTRQGISRSPVEEEAGGGRREA